MEYQKIRTVNINGNSVDEFMGQSLLATFVKYGKDESNAVSHIQLKGDSDIISFNDIILKEAIVFPAVFIRYINVISHTNKTHNVAKELRCQYRTSKRFD